MTQKEPPILATKVLAEKEGLRIATKDGTYFTPWGECSPLLAKATELERTFIDVLPSGYGIHWPLIDEDLAVGPLVKGRKPISGVRQKKASA